jgi:hypothetical protein
LQCTNRENAVAVSTVAEKRCPIDGIYSTEAYWNTRTHSLGFDCGHCCIDCVKEVSHLASDESFASGFANHIYDVHGSHIISPADDDDEHDVCERVTKDRSIRTFARQYCDCFNAVLKHHITPDMVQDVERILATSAPTRVTTLSGAGAVALAGAEKRVISTAVFMPGPGTRAGAAEARETSSDADDTPVVRAELVVLEQ